MTSTTDPGPFGGSPTPEVELEHAPLARVLAQLRFEPLGIFSVREQPIRGFVDQLLDRFPLYEEGFETEITLGPDGVKQSPSQSKTWRLKTSDGAWVVTVANGSLALETTAYSSRSEFIELFTQVVDTFYSEVGRSPTTRLGVRYTNRIAVPEGKTTWLKTILRPEAYGGLAVNLTDGVELRHSVNDWSFSLGDAVVQARSGILPENSLFDPTLVVIPDRHWFLDIDSYLDEAALRSAEQTGAAARELATYAYNLFRWVVTEEFIQEFGGGK